MGVSLTFSAGGWNRQEKPFELNIFKIKENFLCRLLDQASEIIPKVGAQPVMKPLWYTNRSGDISIWQRTANKSNVWSASTDDPVHDIQSNWWSLRFVTLVNVIHVCLKYWFKVFTLCYVSKYCMIQKLPLVLKFHGFSLRYAKRS